MEKSEEAFQIYKNGWDLREQGDEQGCAALFLKAANMGLSKAQNSLALCYWDGRGIQLDSKQAFYWFELAAEQNHPDALYNLSNRYMLGKDVAINKTKAAWYARKSAQLGYVEAAYNYGLYCLFGDGEQINLWEAYYWFEFASRNTKDDEVRIKSKNRVTETRDLIIKENMDTFIEFSEHVDDAGSSLDTVPNEYIFQPVCRSCWKEVGQNAVMCMNCGEGRPAVEKSGRD